MNVNKPIEKVATPPTTIVAPIQEANNENPNEQILGVVRELRIAEEVETTNVVASTPREVQTHLDVEYATGV